MKASMIIKILVSHDIQVKEEGSQIFALEVGSIVKDDVITPFEEWVNCTNWTYVTLMEWLGY